MNARPVRAAVTGAILAMIVWTIWLFVRAATDVALQKAGGAAVGSASITIDSTHLMVAAVLGAVVGWVWRATPRGR